MDFGFGIPTRGPLANFESISEIVTSGEKLGFGIVSKRSCGSPQEHRFHIPI